MADGWIKLHRKARHSSMWKNWELWRLFEWCLMEAAYKPVTVYVGYQAVDLQPGQLIFGRRMAHKETGLSEQTVRTCLHVLTSGKNPALTIESTKAYSIATIVNWDRYQNGDDEDNQQVTHEPTNGQPTSNPRPTQVVDGFTGETSPPSPRACAPAQTKGEEVKESKEGKCAEQKPPCSALFPELPAAQDTPKPSKPKIQWDGTDFTIPNSFYAAWDKAYPEVNVDREINKAAAWLIANPKRAKKDYARFLNNWMGRAKPEPPGAEGEYTVDPALAAWADEEMAKGLI